MDDQVVWKVLAEQGRMTGDGLDWLARQTGIPLARLHYMRRRTRKGYWRYSEAEAISRALGVPREVLFGAGARVLPPGRQTGRWGRGRRALAHTA